MLGEKEPREMYGVREHWPKRLRKRTLIVAEGKWACRGKRDNTHISRIFLLSCRCFLHRLLKDFALSALLFICFSNKALSSEIMPEKVYQS
jgi:hypothetical protein